MEDGRQTKCNAIRRSSTYYTAEAILVHACARSSMGFGEKGLRAVHCRVQGQRVASIRSAENHRDRETFSCTTKLFFHWVVTCDCTLSCTGRVAAANHQLVPQRLLLLASLTCAGATVPYIRVFAQRVSWTRDAWLLVHHTPVASLLLCKTMRPYLVFKKFQDFSSHRILRHIHKALNIDKKTNYTVCL